MENTLQVKTLSSAEIDQAWAEFADSPEAQAYLAALTLGMTHPIYYAQRILALAAERGLPGL